MSRNEGILKGSIFLSLTKFVLPILLSLILQALYGAIDLLMVSHFAEASDIAAVSTGSQAISIATGAITGLTMGITILIGEAIGEKNELKARSAIANGAHIFTIITIIIALLLVLLSRPIVIALQVPEEAIAKTTSYIIICGLGMFFVTAFNVFNAIFCGIGNSKTPLIFVTIAAISNVLLDYLFVELLSMGSTGAALATILAQAISVLSSSIMIKYKLPFKMKKSDFKINRTYIKDILRLGSPVALVRVCNELSYLIILGFVNTLGLMAASGVGIAEKVIMFMLLIPTAYMQAIATFVAQNKGAGNLKRAKRAMNIGMLSSFIISLIMGYTSIFHGDILSMAFVQDEEIVHLSHMFLKATSLECIILSLTYAYDGYFNGIGKTTFVMIQGIIGAIIIRIPFAYIIMALGSADVFKIGLSEPASALVMLIMAIIYYQIIKNKDTNTL